MFVKSIKAAYADSWLHHQNPIRGPLSWVRVLWLLGESALDENLQDNKLGVLDAPCIVSLGYKQYDVAVSACKLDDFEKLYFVVAAFDDSDPLVSYHGRRGAVARAIKQYETAKLNGVWNGVEPYFEERLAYLKQRNETK